MTSAFACRASRAASQIDSALPGVDPGDERPVSEPVKGGDGQATIYDPHEDTRTTIVIHRPGEREIKIRYNQGKVV